MKDEILCTDGNDGQTRSQSQRGTSIVVRQFVALMRGEDAPHEPVNPWRVEAVNADERYCLACYGITWFDVVQAVTADRKPLMIFRCRRCGAESGG